MSISVWAVNCQNAKSDFEYICDDFGLSEETRLCVLSKKRDKKTCDIRQKIAIELHKLGYSSTEIARSLNRNHSSILYLIKERKIAEKI